MPEIRYYTVTQEREIKISASDPVEAAALAKRVFSLMTSFADNVNIQQRPREISIFIQEERAK